MLNFSSSHIQMRRSGAAAVFLSGRTKVIITELSSEYTEKLAIVHSVHFACWDFNVHLIFFDELYNRAVMWSLSITSQFDML